MLRPIRTVGTAVAVCFALTCGSATAIELPDPLAGREFVLGFLPNTLSINHSVQVQLSSEQPTIVTIEYPLDDPTFTTTAELTPGEVSVVEIPTDAANAWAAGAVSRNAVRLSADEPFRAVMVNQRRENSGAALAYPVRQLNLRYLVTTYFSNTVSADRAAFVVVAASDDTVVTITPTADLQGGHAAGVPFEVDLDRGEGFLAQSTTFGASGDLTGSSVEATRSVVVTNGNLCTNVPPSQTFCDQTFEVAPPTQYWGDGAIVENFKNLPNGAVYRVLAADDDTTVRLDDDVIGTVNRGEFLELGPLVGSHVFAADGRILVTQFMTGVNPGNGDPAQVHHSSPALYITDYTFATVETEVVQQHFVTIVATTSDVTTGAVLLDGTPVPFGDFAPVDGTGYWTATLPLSSGAHSTSTTRGHNIVVYGVGPNEGYAYSNGIGLRFSGSTDLSPPICSLEVNGSFGEGLAVDDRAEDANGNCVLDPGEDSDGNGVLDQDVGVILLDLLPNTFNATLLRDFTPLAPSVEFSVEPTNPAFFALGSVFALDGVGNACVLPFQLGDFDPVAEEEVSSTAVVLDVMPPSGEADGVRCGATTEPACEAGDPSLDCSLQLDGQPFVPIDESGAEVEVALSDVDGLQRVCCEFRGTNGEISLAACDAVVLNRCDPVAGMITAPQAGSCFGPADGPVIIEDDFVGTCGEIERSYVPGPGPGYSTHGDFAVSLSVADAEGNQATDSVAFTIDLIPPTVDAVTDSHEVALGQILSMGTFGDLFASDDTDGASGDVLAERIYLNGCLVLDGATDGDRDGLLRDDSVPALRATVLANVEACTGTSVVPNRGELRIEAEDCGGNLGVVRIELVKRGKSRGEPTVAPPDEFSNGGQPVELQQQR